MSIGENIKRIRKERNLTQKELGEKLGISQAAIGQFESNHSNLKSDTIKKIAEALECTEQEIFGYNDHVYALHKAIEERNALQNVNIEDDWGFLDEILISDTKLLSDFHKLNIYGKREALLRVSELKYVPRYTNDDNLPFK